MYLELWLNRDDPEAAQVPSEITLARFRMVVDNMMRFSTPLSGNEYR